MADGEFLFAYYDSLCFAEPYIWLQGQWQVKVHLSL